MMPRRPLTLEALISRTRRALRNETGNLMITTLIGSVVMLIVVGAIASGIVGIMLFQKTASDKSAVTDQVSLTDSAFRNDVQWASRITATDNKQVQLTVPGQDGTCKESTWAITVSGAATVVRQTVVGYPSFDASVNPVVCTGTPTAPYAHDLVTDASPTSAFTYANPGGRGLTFTAGTGTPDDTTAPAGVSPKTWASSKVAAVALSTTVANSTDNRADYRFAQTADNLSTVQGPADAAQHLVPEGDLTALP